MSEHKMRPMMIIPPNILSAEDVKKLDDNGICVVVATDPSLVRFADPIPCISTRSQIEHAAIRLSCRILNATGENWTTSIAKEWFVKFLIDGSPLDPNINKLGEIYTFEKQEEYRRMARADAKAERDAKKAQKKT